MLELSDLKTVDELFIKWNAETAKALIEKAGEEILYHKNSYQITLIDIIIVKSSPEMIDYILNLPINRERFLRYSDYAESPLLNLLNNRPLLESLFKRLSAKEKKILFNDKKIQHIALTPLQFMLCSADDQESNDFLTTYGGLSLEYTIKSEMRLLLCFF